MTHGVLLCYRKVATRMFNTVYFNPFYISAFVWNLAHGMGGVLVPLYALHLGMSGVAIGSLVALPVILQVLFNLLGGVYVDRLGAKNIMIGSSLVFMLGNAVYSFSGGFAGMIMAQCLYVLARATFWPAAYALGSRLPGERNRNLGWLNSTTNAGQIGGTALAGILIGLFGFQICFWIGVCTLLVAFLLGFFIGETRGTRPAAEHPGILLTYRNLARVPAMYFAMACGYLSVLPYTLSGSFYPILLVGEGFSTQVTGWLLTLRAFGSILAGIGLAKTVRTPAGLAVPVWCSLVIAIAIVTSALSDRIWIIGISIFFFGMASGLASIYFQLFISAVSADRDRGSAMSFGGLGWQVSNISTPLLMGFLMDGIGLREAFYIIGGSLLVLTALLPALHRWGLAGRTFTDSR